MQKNKSNATRLLLPDQLVPTPTTAAEPSHQKNLPPVCCFSPRLVRFGLCNIYLYHTIYIHKRIKLLQRDIIIPKLTYQSHIL